MRVGLTITKSTLFRGVQQEFSNTYHYELETAVAAPAEAILDEVVVTERKLHASTVNFVRGQVWSTGGTPGQNQMLFQKNLSGAGSATPSTSMDRERALLFRWKAGFDGRGIQVYLRKWYHVCGNPTGMSINVDGILANTQQIGATDRTALATIANEVRSVISGTPWELVGPGGRDATDDAVCHPYLEHHQLGEAWR